MLRVRVPASSANLGPGFDALGLALDLRLEVVAAPAEADAFEYRGHGPAGLGPAGHGAANRGPTGHGTANHGRAPAAHDNLIHQGFRAVYRELGRPAPAVAFTVDNPIPLARGLGSSSAALVAGAASADAMLGEPLGRDGVFGLTAALEGHPDNVGPAVYGGLTVAAADEDGRFVAASLPLPAAWRLLFGVPAFELPTAEARAVLPSSYTPAQVVLTASRSALWVAAVAQDRPELLRAASLDVAHQPFRLPLVPGLAEVLADLRAAGAYAAYLSGAGPTVGVIVGADALERCRGALRRFVGVEGCVLEPRTATGYAVERW